MFDFFRNHQKWMQFILLVLIVPPFVLLGVQGYSRFLETAPKMATVNGEPITQQAYQQALRSQIDQYHQMLGDQFDAAAVDTPAMRQDLLDRLINQRVLADTARTYRFSVSDQTLRNTIASDPSVQDDGKFSPEKYRQILAAQGLTPAAFEANLRGQLALGRVLEPIAMSARIPSQVLGDITTALTQTRNVQLRRFAAADFRSKVTVTPQDVQSWYDANKAQFQIPEQVRVQYLVLDEAAASAGIQVKDEDVASYYDQNKNRYGQPERRRASHIMIEVPANASAQARTEAKAKAEAIARQAAADPSKFADLAKQDSQDAGSAVNGGDLGWVSKGMLAAPLEQAIYGLNKDQVSGVVESPYGYHVIKVTEVEPGHIKPLAEVRDQIVNEIRKQIAANRYSDMATKLTSLVYDQRDSLQPAADALGLKVRQASGVTRTGLLPPDQAGPDPASSSKDSQLLDNPRVRQELFTPEVLRNKLNSGVIQVSPDTLVVVHVADVTPAHIPALDQVKDKVQARLTDQRAAEAADQAGEQMLAALQKDPGQAADGFTPAVDVSRRDPGPLQQGVLEAVMRAPVQPLPGYVGVKDPSGYTIARIDKVDPGKADPALQEQLAQQLSNAWGQAEDRAVLQMLRDSNKVQIAPEGAPLLKGDQESQTS
jgi:peptidyl-prolyl cis-trans isomerase D